MLRIALLVLVPVALLLLLLLMLLLLEVVILGILMMLLLRMLQVALLLIHAPSRCTLEWRLAARHFASAAVVVVTIIRLVRTLGRRWPLDLRPGRQLWRRLLSSLQLACRRSCRRLRTSLCGGRNDRPERRRVEPAACEPAREVGQHWVVREQSCHAPLELAYLYQFPILRFVLMKERIYRLRLWQCLRLLAQTAHRRFEHSSGIYDQETYLLENRRGQGHGNCRG